MYQYHRVNKFETVEDILMKYNMELKTLVNLNKLRYPTLIVNSYMIFEGWLLLVIFKDPNGEVI